MGKLCGAPSWFPQIESYICQHFFISDDNLYLYFDLNSSTILMNSERSEVGLCVFYQIHDYYRSSNSAYIEDNYDFYLSNAKFVLNGKIFYPVECTSYGWRIGDVHSDYYFDSSMLWSRANVN